MEIAFFLCPRSQGNQVLNISSPICWGSVRKQCQDGCNFAKWQAFPQFWILCQPFEDLQCLWRWRNLDNILLTPLPVLAERTAFTACPLDLTSPKKRDDSEVSAIAWLMVLWLWKRPREFPSYNEWILSAVEKAIIQSEWISTPRYARFIVCIRSDL